MIQRVQSAYLAIALLIQSLQLRLTWTVYHTESSDFMLTGMYNQVPEVNSIPLAVGLGTSLVLILMSVFTFRKRTNQMKLIDLTMLQMVVVIGLFSWIHYQNIEVMEQGVVGKLIDIEYKITVILPLISLVFCWLAKKSVKKDDDLVKSVDRLR
jgi:hypothetical protein